MRPEDLPKIHHERVGERMARSSEEIRSRLEEARRMNMEEMRQLQKCVYVCMCVCAVRTCTYLDRCLSCAVHVCLSVCLFVCAFTAVSF